MWRWIKNRALAHLVIVLIFLVLLTVLYQFGFGLLTEAELITVDDRVRYGRATPVNPDLVFLGIDTPSVSLNQLDDQTVASSHPLSIMKAGYPFSRELYATICDRLLGAGARVVAFDIFFLSPKPEDPIFRSTLDTYRDRVVIGMNFSDDQQNGFSTTLKIPSETLFPDQDPSDSRLAYLNFWKDSYGVVRNAQYRQNIRHLTSDITGGENEPKLYSLAARTVQKAGYPQLIPDDLGPRRMRFAGKPETKFPTFSLYQIFDPHYWSVNFHNGDFFRGKIVLVGPLGDWTKDELMTPWGLMDGAEIHLNAMNDLLQRDFLLPPSDAVVYATLLAAALSSFALAFWIIPVAWRFLATLGVLGGYGTIVILAYNGPGWLLPVVAPVGVFAGASGAGFIYDFVLNQIEKLRLRATFERYNSKNVVKYLLEHTDSYNEMLAGARLPVSVLFSDVRDFTTIAEDAADSQRLVAKLNEYLTAMVACVFRYDGTLDSFMGDGLMAVWGNTPYNFGPKEDAVRAVKAAMAMMVELRRLNAKWLAEGGTAWRIGIGLNHGQVIVGDIGSQEHKEFACIGDATNLGARLEGATKEYHLEILIGEDLVELVTDRFHLRSVDVIKVKGKKRAVKTFTVLGESTEKLAPDLEKFLALHEEALAAFRNREFARARDLFIQALKLYPDDFLAQQYLASCEDYILHPPDETWTGIRVMTKK